MAKNKIQSVTLSIDLDIVIANNSKGLSDKKRKALVNSIVANLIANETKHALHTIHTQWTK